jgi:hypothetical protein
VESEFYTGAQKKKMKGKYEEFMSFLHELRAGVYSEQKEQVETLKAGVEKYKHMRKYMRNVSLRHASKWRKPKMKEHAHFG